MKSAFFLIFIIVALLNFGSCNPLTIETPTLKGKVLGVSISPYSNNDIIIKVSGLVTLEKLPLLDGKSLPINTNNNIYLVGDNVYYIVLTTEKALFPGTHILMIQKSSLLDYESGLFLNHSGHIFIVP